MVDLDEIKKRWGDAKKGSQYYADIHALMDEVESLKAQRRRLRDALGRIQHWGVFPNLSVDIANRALEE